MNIFCWPGTRCPCQSHKIEDSLCILIPIRSNVKIFSHEKKNVMSFCTANIYYSLTCIKQASKGYQNVLALDKGLLNTGTFQFICFYWELNKCLLNTGCLLNRGGH